MWWDTISEDLDASVFGVKERWWQQGAPRYYPTTVLCGIPTQKTLTSIVNINSITFIKCTYPVASWGTWIVQNLQMF